MATQNANFERENEHRDNVVPGQPTASSMAGKENYFFKKKFVSESKKQWERSQICANVASFQSCSNPLSFLARKQPSQHSLSKAYESHKQIQGDKQKGSRTVQCAAQPAGKSGPTNPSSKRRNKSLSIKKFSFDKAQTANNQLFCKSFAQNTKKEKRHLPPEIVIGESPVNDSLAELEQRLQKVASEVSSGEVGASKGRRRVLRLLTNLRLKTNDSAKKSGCMASLELVDFLDKKIERLDKRVSQEKRQTESVGVQTAPPVFDLGKFIGNFKDFAGELLREGPKAEFSMSALVSFFKARNFEFEELDFESQKLLKSFCDTVQKQLIFEEVIKILEEENIQIDDFLQLSYERVMGQLVKEREAQNGELEAESEDYIAAQSATVSSALKTSNAVFEEPVKRSGLTINLEGLNREHNAEKTPTGFHQEFLGMADDFSLSWRKQIEKERKRLNQRAV